MSFSILQPGRILFGRGTAAQAPEIAVRLGRRGVIVHGSSGQRCVWLSEAMSTRGADILLQPCATEPTLHVLETALAAARDHRPDWVLSIGGGAAIDLGKAVAALAPGTGSPLDHLEVVGRGLPLSADPLPFVALPTTAGTGAEVTKNAVIGLPDIGRKVSLRDDRMIARVAIVDPALTDGCPRRVTLASGLDAIAQVIEPYLSCRATPYTDALSRAAIAPGLSALMRLMDGEDSAARDTMAWCSLSGGLALANGGLGAVHGLAGVIGGMTPAPHGAICGALLGPVLDLNRRLTTGSARARVDEVCRIVAEALGASEAEAPEALGAWARAVGLSTLTDMGLAATDHAIVAEASLSSSSMKGNPVQPGTDDLIGVLAAAS